MTTIGYVFVATLILGIGLAIGMARRLPRKDGTRRIGTAIFLGFVVVNVTLFFVMVSASLLEAVHGLVTLPKYTAQIVDFDSRWEEVRRSDDEETWTEDVLMHTPILRFVDRSGEVRVVPGTSSSGAEPVVGDTMRVAYEPGAERARVISLASIGVLLGVGAMLAIPGYMLMHAVYFAIGRSRQRLADVGMTILFYGLVPLAMLGLFAGMLWGGVIAFFLPGSDVPVWAFGVSVFFCLVLALATFGWFKTPVMRRRTGDRRARGRRR